MRLPAAGRPVQQHARAQPQRRPAALRVKRRTRQCASLRDESTQVSVLLTPDALSPNTRAPVAGVRPAAHVCETRSVAAVAGHTLLALASPCRTKSRPWTRAHRAQRRAKRVGSASASRSAATASGRPPTSSQPRRPAAAPASARVTPQLAAGAKPSRAAARSAALTCSPPGASLHGLSLRTLLHGGALAQPCEQNAAVAAISTRLVRRCSLNAATSCVHGHACAGVWVCTAVAIRMLKHSSSVFQPPAR